MQWFGNVLVGSEDSSESSCDGISPLRVSVATLLRAYDAVVFASGCEGVRSLGIDGNYREAEVDYGANNLPIHR